MAKDTEIDLVMDEGVGKDWKEIKKRATDKNANQTFLYLKLSRRESQYPVWSGWAAQSQSTR